MTARSDVLFITDKTKLLKSALGQSRRFDGRPATSGLTRLTDIIRIRRHVSNVPCVEAAVAGLRDGAFSLEPFIGPLVKEARRAFFIRQTVRSGRIKVGSAPLSCFWRCRFRCETAAGRACVAGEAWTGRNLARLTRVAHRTRRGRPLPAVGEANDASS